MIPFTSTVLAAISVFASLIPVSAQCTREGLLGAANQYLSAQAAGSTSGLSLATTSFKYQENNKAADISRGLLTKALKIDLNRSTADTVACASYTMFISTAGPYVVSTQIRHDGNDTSTISMIDTIVATTGDWAFNAKQTLSYIRNQTWDTLAPSSQPTRELLRMVGDAYLDMWTDKTAADKIPWGPSCERVEGGAITKNCGSGLPRGGSSKPNGNRRYVIDETMGSVDVLCAFDSLGDMPDSHEIRVQDGKVRYVHTVTV